MNNFWVSCLERFQDELSAQQFNTWIKPLHYRIDEESLTLYAPNRFVQQWVKDKFLNRVVEFAKENLNYPISVDVVLMDIKSDDKVKSIASLIVSDSKQSTDKDTSVNKAKPVDKSTPKEPLNKNIIKTEHSGLNPAFNFSNLVIGRANQLARAAAVQIAENPGDSYNPLFIYGGVGLGKTHLIQAIGNRLKELRPEAKIKYLHAERYVSDVVKAYEHKTFDEFKRLYHSLDMLLIDDIQFFGKKTRTQEEFFYAFNTLIETKKQIIITCDTYPKEIADMEERLRTRFSWGLTVAVEPPELEMRVAILLKKAEEANIALTEEVAFFVAKQIRSSVRELEGALNRIVAMSKFTGNQIDVNLAKDALKDLIAVRGRQITIEYIQKTVADYYKIKVAEMYSKKRTRNFARPRQIAMALTRELTNHSFPEIGEAFGSRHHTTVMHACDEMEQLRQNDQTIARDIAFLVQVIRD
jgi:chromosomal replication initiator protein